MSGVEKLQSTEFHEWDVPTRQFDFERTAVARCPKQHGLLLEARSGLAVLQDTFDDEACLVGFIAHRDELQIDGLRAEGDRLKPSFQVLAGYALMPWLQLITAFNPQKSTVLQIQSDRREVASNSQRLASSHPAGSDR